MDSKINDHLRPFDGLTHFLDPYRQVKEEPDEDVPDFVTGNDLEVASDKTEHLEGNSKVICLDDIPPIKKNRTDSESSEDNTYQENDQYKCKICTQFFPNLDDIMEHMMSRKLPDKKSQCCNCKKIFRDNTQMKVHARKHTGEKPYECNVCGKQFTVNGNLSKHKRIHTGEKRYECKECGRKFTQFAHLEDHLKTHSEERPFLCDLCNMSFKTQSRLTKHRRGHENEKGKRVVKCPKCDLILRNIKQLATHMTNHQESTEGPFMCHLCGQSYDEFEVLKIHQQNHKKDLVLACTFCDRTFTCSSHLRRHINSHSGLKPYFCEVCRKGFSSCQNMKRHMMTHTGEKPYKCDQCDRGFLTLENMNRHKRTHTGEKPFKCQACGKTFAHSTTLQEHHRTIHTDEKPFGCSLCNKRFPISKALYRHIRERHPEHFSDFKKANDITPNQKRALKKIGQKEQPIQDDVKIKKEIIEEDKNKVEKLPNLNLDQLNSDESKDLVIKHEPIDSDEKRDYHFPENVNIKTDPDNNILVKTETP